MSRIFEGGCVQKLVIFRPTPKIFPTKIVFSLASPSQVVLGSNFLLRGWLYRFRYCLRYRLGSSFTPPQQVGLLSGLPPPSGIGCRLWRPHSIIFTKWFPCRYHLTLIDNLKNGIGIISQADTHHGRGTEILGLDIIISWDVKYIRVWIISSVGLRHSVHMQEVID